MSEKTDLKSQRDRFLAFSFASADLFLEVGERGIVDYALGASKSLTGVDHEKLVGKNWLELFSGKDKMPLSALGKRAMPGQRCGPLHVKMDEKLGAGREAILTAIRMPDNSKLYVTVGFVSDLMLKLAQVVSEQENVTLLTKDGFLHAAQETIGAARAMGQDIDITLFDIPAHAQIKKRLGNEMWGEFTETITEFLAVNSVDGHAAAKISDGRYSLIHDPSIDSENLKKELAELTKRNDPAGQGFEFTSKTVSADLQSLSEREAAKALVYTINEFERKGTAINIETLNSGFKAYVSANAQKIQQLKVMVEQLNFDLHFQPVVTLDKYEVSHYEILSRFKGQGSTQEWVIFAEDIGMAADFDIAVCERVINYLLYKASGNRMKFSMNLSGQSIQNEQFFKTLMAKLTINKDLSQRLIFEITESNTITAFEMVNHFIIQMKDAGFKTCLDDFGAGAASFKYLQQLHVDYVKIDGQYTRKVVTSERDQFMVKNLCQLCKDLKMTTIAEQLETDEQIEMMKRFGVVLGQGFYFGYPGLKPEFYPDKLPAKSKA